ncbi:MAG: response regulator [Myxococcales bacterium]|nr:response regulator [Myxococcales bacterium]
MPRSTASDVPVRNTAIREGLARCERCGEPSRTPCGGRESDYAWLVVAEAPILVVDDNAENRALAQATLEDEGYTVALARDGAEALAAFEALRPRCILMDVQMPGVDGISACEQIRRRAEGHGVAIVFVTAQRDITTFDRALAAGGDDFLTKPFRPSELVVRVEAAMRVRRLAGERTDLYAEIKHQRDDLQRLQLAKEQLSGFLVHDLKNPVNAIELQAERLLRDPGATERTRSAATAIRGEARSLLRMILNLLDLSRSDEGRLSPARETLELAPFMATVIDELDLAARSCGVALVVEADGEIHADPALLQRVLANLVENAIRHSPDGGTVRITATPVARAVELRVADAGTGVPAELRDRVFQRFETAGGARNRGLGLAFCKVAVEAHGGSIWIEDASPGAVFCFTIPA